MWTTIHELELHRYDVNFLESQYTVSTFYMYIHMWQSRVEIEGYSIAYFERIAVFEAPYC